MSLWVKVCGNTSVEDALLAAESGADAVGFVFAASPRRVTEEQVAAIVPGLPAELEKIGVFVESTFEEIEAAVSNCGLTGVQILAGRGFGMSARLRARFGNGLRILRVVHFGELAAQQVAAIAAEQDVDAILVDSRTATAVGGTGLVFDWNRARETVFAGRSSKRLVAAGGLSPANVADAIAMLRPWGVDVVSGVEAAPGRKDAAKVRGFVAKARAAHGRLAGISS
ncbi:MAG TPA: phosphoribosylanthranilate isomerase [Terracidiphilus sp.]|jgi:phosphoribosylanthranilate isomerase|nr:phosphoribosylanthranilate isomerase [Terracidiphilus sp.]